MASMKTPPPELLDEPSLDELMSDPIIQLIMQRDGVSAKDMRGELDRVKRVYADFVMA